MKLTEYQTYQTFLAQLPHTRTTTAALHVVGKAVIADAQGQFPVLQALKWEFTDAVEQGQVEWARTGFLSRLLKEAEETLGEGWYERYQANLHSGKPTLDSTQHVLDSIKVFVAHHQEAEPDQILSRLFRAAFSSSRTQQEAEQHQAWANFLMDVLLEWGVTLPEGRHALQALYEQVYAEATAQ